MALDLEAQYSTKIKDFYLAVPSGYYPNKIQAPLSWIFTDPICLRCGTDVETMEHTFRDCSWSSFFWQASILRLQHSFQHLSLQDWILLITRNKDAEYVESFVALLWTMWRARNLLIFQNRIMSHRECFSLAQISLHEYQMANLSHLPCQTRTHPLTRWQPPDAHWIKFNSDASLDPFGATGYGGVFRDCRGFPLKFVSEFLPFCPDVEVAEALACLKGITVALFEGYQAVIF